MLMGAFYGSTTWKEKLMLSHTKIENAKPKITPNLNVVSPEYLIYFLISPLGKSEILLHTTTTSQAALSMGKIRKFRILLPLLEEQKIIIEKIHSIDAARKQGEKALKKLIGLKKGLMSDLLTGRVRVKTDQIKDEAA